MGKRRTFDWLILLFLVGVSGCQPAAPILTKQQLRSGKADVAAGCAQLGLASDCDVCQEYGWYDDDECDSDLIHSGVCAGIDSDCSTITYRLSELSLADPHVFAKVTFLCPDGTSEFNNFSEDAIEKDEDGDGFLDLSLLVSIIEPIASANSLLFSAGLCPVDGGACSIDPDAKSVSLDVTPIPEPGALCLQPLEGTTGGYNPAPKDVTGPCLVTGPGADLSLTMGGVEMPLSEAQMAAPISADTTVLSDGFFKGFLSESDADSIRLPDELPFVGGKILSRLFRGGADNCRSGSDKDLAQDGTTPGWYFYLNFDAQQIELAAGER